MLIDLHTKKILIKRLKLNTKNPSQVGVLNDSRLALFIYTDFFERS